MNYTPLTELEAVNQILATVGESPVNTLDNPGVSVASLAQTMLHDVSRTVQSIGFHCNYEEEYPLVPDVNGFIYIPNNTLKIDASDKTMDIVQRGNRLYDRRKDKHTFIFTEPVKVDIVFFLAFSDLPQVIRKYITVKAGREFQAKFLSSDIIHRLTERDEMEALYNLQDEEIFCEDFSIFNSYETFKIINRN